MSNPTAEQGADIPRQMPEYITGYFVRIKRDDRWQSLDLATLSAEELAEFFKEIPHEKIITWIHALTSWIREHVV